MVWEARNWWLCPAQEAPSPRRWPHNGSHRRRHPRRAATVPLKAAAATGRIPRSRGNQPRPSSASESGIPRVACEEAETSTACSRGSQKNARSFSNHTKRRTTRLFWMIYMQTPLQGGPAPATLTCNMMRTCDASLPGCRSLWRRFQREWQLWRNDWVARSSSCHHHQRTKLQKSQKQEPQPQKSHPTRTGWNAPESQGSSTSFIRNIRQLIVKKNFDTSPWNKFWYHYSVIQCYFIRFHPSCTWK